MESVNDFMEIVIEELMDHFNTHGWKIDTHMYNVAPADRYKLIVYCIARMPFLQCVYNRYLVNTRELVFYSPDKNMLYVSYCPWFPGIDFPLGPL